MKILAFETSCDETACAIVEDGRRVLANVVLSQVDLHAQYGGVLPEIAAREHLSTIHLPLTLALEEANLQLHEIDAIAATMGPGLIGALLIGATAAKTLCLLENKPFRGVHHLVGHVASNFLESNLEPPFLCLLVSGGHTQLLHVEDYTTMHLLGQSVDDAVGEAYDKVARLLDLGYPGGPKLDRLAQGGDPNRIPLPIPRLDNPYNFSFSGIKTACLRKRETEGSALTDPKTKAQWTQDMAASFQKTAVDILVKTTVRCAKAHNLNTIAVCGGVSANRELRTQMKALENPDHPLISGKGFQIYFPDFSFCTDNAAMIASAAYYHPWTEDWTHEVFSRGPIPTSATGFHKN